MAHVFVEDVGAPELAAGDRHHLERVLRLRPGAPVTASDGAGGWRDCRLAAGGRLEPVGPPTVVPPPEPALTVGLALTKGARPELAVQKLTELGVDRILLFLAERSVARWEGDRAARHVERLRRVAREAGTQAALARLPAVDGVAAFEQVAALPGVALAVPGGADGLAGRTTLLVGPEGGWAPGERSLGLPEVALGPTTVRAETAAIAAGALLTALRSGVLVARGVPDA